MESAGEVLYGLDRELAEKAAAKYDPDQEAQVRRWIEAVTGERLGGSSLQRELKSGVVLCNLIAIIQPGVCMQPSPSHMPFKQMENIAAYLVACDRVGVPKHEQFQTVSLFEDKDMGTVLKNIEALGRCAQSLPGYRGPSMGARMASQNVRVFSVQQLCEAAAAPTFVGQGSCGGATAAGNFDRSRDIVKWSCQRGSGARYSGAI